MSQGHVSEAMNTEKREAMNLEKHRPKRDRARAHCYEKIMRRQRGPFTARSGGVICNGLVAPREGLGAVNALKMHSGCLPC